MCSHDWGKKMILGNMKIKTFFGYMDIKKIKFREKKA